MTPLRRALERAVTGVHTDAGSVVDRVIDCLVNEPLMVVLSGLSEEVIANRARGSNFRA